MDQNGANVQVFCLTLDSIMGFLVTQMVKNPLAKKKKESTCNAGDLGGEDPREKEMATHSSVFAWKIPRTAEPSGLQSMGSPRVGQN